MSEEDQRQLKANALLDYTEHKQEAALLQEKLSKIGDFFIEIGGLLKTDPHMYLYRGFTFPDKKEIDDTARELDAVVNKIREAKAKAASFGLSV